MRVYAFISIFLISCNAIAQSIPVTNLYDNRMFYNPAFVGNNTGVSFATLTNRLIYRPNSGPLSLNMAMAELNSCKLPKVGLGLIVNQQNEGDGRLKSNLVRPIISYNKKLLDMIKVSLGIQFNLQNNYIDWSSLIFSDQLDPLQGNVFTSSNANANWVSTNNVNVGAGVKIEYYIKPYWFLKPFQRYIPIIRKMRNNKYYGNFGISRNNIGNNNDGLLGNNLMQRTQVIHGSISLAEINIFKIDEELVPYFRHHRETFGNVRYQMLDIGTFLQTSLGYLTLGHRNSNNVINNYNSVIFGIAPTVKMNKNSQDAIRISYHADINYNMSNKANAFANTVNHEISLVWIFNTKGCGNLPKVNICEQLNRKLPPFVNAEYRKF